MEEKLAVQSSKQTLFTILSCSKKKQQRGFQLATKKSEKVATSSDNGTGGSETTTAKSIRQLLRRILRLLLVSKYADVSSQHNKANILDPRDRVT